MSRKVLFLLSLIILSVSALPVMADEYDPQKIPGAWKLDRVYEYASGETPIELEPESAASVYAEKNNIYTFMSQNNIFTDCINGGGDSHKRLGKWEENDDEYILHYDSGEDMVFHFDREKSELHRYWAADTADSMYHDLDFVYTRVPAGMWMLKHVLSAAEDGQEWVTLDPENAASLYAERYNLYYMNDDWSASVTVAAENDTFPVDDPDGKWSGNGESYLFDVDGYEMELFYDKEANELHRFWKDDNAGGMYLNLDFVYFRPSPL